MQWYVLLGVSTGMRTMTATAVMCWFAWLHLLPQSGWTALAGNPICVGFFTVAALVEYFGDTLPITPSRTDLPLMLARVAFGAVVGTLAARAVAEPIAGGIVFAVVGALIGTYGGVRLRLWGARLVGRDLPVALGESALALVLAVTAAYFMFDGMLHAKAMLVLRQLFVG